MKTKELVKKAHRVLKEEGAEMLVRKARLYLKNLSGGEKMYSDSELAHNCFMDVLFINGCYLAHPSRYRVAHQREQLKAGNISTAEVFYKDLSIDMVKNFRAFIFFRCPYSEEIEAFIKKAKEYNKTVLFDIDDLMIDTEYTDTIPYVQAMSESERKLYDDGVIATGKLLQLCDGAITTTEALAAELKKYVSEVHINRNVASEEMIQLSRQALGQKQHDPNRKIIGYFSGSITHNPDFAIVLPALIRLMETYETVELLLVGDLDIPGSLEAYKNRITVMPMRQWRKLPSLIASVDINIAPLEDTIFNRAKSENKWMEAALVKVPTVASCVGSFETMVKDGENGLLCSNTEDAWFHKLELLLTDDRLRESIAENAYKHVCQYCSTVYTAADFSDYIYHAMRPNVVFMLPTVQISGGVLVTLKHGSILQKDGYDVTIFNDGYEKDVELESNGCKFPVISKRTIQIRAMLDKCVATLWSTCEFFDGYGKIKERYYLIQNYETDFYQPGEALRVRANAMYRLRVPVKYITISKWCESWLEKDYSLTASYAPNGLETERFYPQKRVFSGRIRILVEGNSDDYYKNVDESFRITNQLDPEKYEVWYMSYQGKPKEWYRVDRFLHKIPYDQVPDIYRQCHILIKSSILESFSYPPLEMMATGGNVVVAPNGGNMEYLRDGENCLFYQQGNEKDALEKITRIVECESLRMKLIRGGIRTGQERSWKNIEAAVLALYQQ